MQSKDLAEKIKILIDGEELSGLVEFGEVIIEKGEIEVPEFHKIRKIQSGLSKMPSIDMTFKISRGSKILKILRDWYFNDEVHDVVKIRCDATGTEFARTLFPSCECVKYQEPAFSGMTPNFAQCQTRLLVWDVIPTDSI